MRTCTIFAALLFLGACALPFAERGGSGFDAGGPGVPREVGTLFDPFCAPDGSVVRLIYPNSQGNFDTALSSRENCPWNK